MSIKGQSVRSVSLLLAMSFLSQLCCNIDFGAFAASASTETFIIRYSTYQNSTTETSHSTEWHLDVYSNGTAFYRFISYDWTVNKSWELSTSLASELCDTLIGEGFMLLDCSSYDDSGWNWEVVGHTERLHIEVPNGTKTVLFSGHSIMGIVPKSYALLNNLMLVVLEECEDIPDVTLDIVVSEPPDPGPVANITAHLTNNGPTTLLDSGLCNTSWPTFIVSVNGSTVGDLQGRLFPACVMEFPPLETTDFGPWSWNRSGLSPGKYVIMSRAVIWDYEIGEIASDSNWTWIPDDGQSELDEDRESISLVLAGLCIVAAITITALSVFHFGRRRSHRGKEA